MRDGAELAELERHMAAVARLQLETFEDIEPRGIELEHTWRKRFSVVHRYRIEGDRGTAIFFVKAPFEDIDGTEDTGGSHMRLSPTRPAESRALLQSAALRDLGRAIEQAGQPHLAAVGILPGSDERVVVMTAAGGRSLRHHVVRQVRWRRPHADLDAVFERAGALLRIFHAEIDRTDAPATLVDRDEIVSRALLLVDRVGSATERDRHMAAIGPRLASSIETHLPRRLDVTTRFGDYGLTNIHVDDAGTVTAIDTLAATRAPALHDATYFVTAITSLRPQLATRGRAIPQATTGRWLESFWRGYAGDRSIPTGAIETWSSLRLLERWAAKSQRASPRLGSAGVKLLLDHPMITLIQRSLDRAEQSDPRPDLLELGAPP